MSKITPQEAYQVLQEASGIKVGDRVRVLRAAKNGELGWIQSWVPSMNDAIGKELVVKHVIDSGIQLTNDKLTYTYPFFVLEKITPPPPKPIRINNVGDYHATVHHDHVIVGCQKLIHEKVLEVADAIHKIRGEEEEEEEDDTPKYRLLEEGEIIQEGDEYDPECGRYETVDPNSDNSDWQKREGSAIGERFSKEGSYYCATRRKI